VNPLYNALPVFAQNLAFTLGGYWVARTRFSRFFHQTLEEWERTVHGPLLHLRAEQRERLDRLVRHARENVPYYRDLPRPSHRYDPDEAIADTLARIQPLDKATYRDRWQEFIARNISLRRQIRVSTSGTTGTALRLWVTPQRLAENFAAVWRQRRLYGADLSDPNLTFNGRMIVPAHQKRPPFWRRNAYAKQTLFSVYHMSPQHLPFYVEAIHATPARYAQGYPSALHLVGRAMLEAGRPLPPGRLVAVFTSSESLLSFQRAVIEEAFGAPVRDHYAASEQAVSMTACPLNRLHVDMEYCIVEVEPEEETETYVSGPLLVTGLGNDVLPFLRYRIGDVGTMAKTPCPCGRPGDSFFEIEGRVEDYVVTPDGRLVGRLDHIFKEQLDIGEAQIVQDRDGALRVLVVPQPSWSDDSERSLRKEIHARLGDEIRVEIVRVESIPREPSGKFRAVKSFEEKLGQRSALGLAGGVA
jgi:phenylacetate-CoA ligase